MKLSPLNFSTICICIGLGGFMSGKLISGNAEVPGKDKHPAASERVIQQRSVDARSHSRTRQPSNRAKRTTQQSGSASLNQKLTNLEKISSDGNPLASGRAMLNWINSLAPEEFETAAEKFRSLQYASPHNIKNSDYIMLMAAWGEVDPISALAYTSQKKAGSMDCTSIVLSTWAIRDPDAAIAWAKSKHKGDKENPFMINIISGILGADPVRAKTLLQELPSGYVRDKALTVMTSHLVAIGEEAAKNLISGLSDQSLRSDAITRLAVTWAQKDPARSATWLLENINKSTVQCVDAIFTRWTKKDPAEAIANFQNIQDREVRSRALKGIVMGDDHGDPQAAVDLMNRFASDLTEETVVDFIRTTMGQTPNLAIDQIRRIQDESTRNDLYIDTLSSWLKEDGVAAKNWISFANLPASVIEALNKAQDQN